MYEFKPVSDRVKKMHQRVRDRIIQIDAERATIITESSKKYEAVTPIIKRPLVTHDVCSQMTVLVDDEDRFVGNRGAHFCGAGVNPEWAGGGWIPGVIKKGQWKLEEDGMYHSSKEEDTKCCITKEDYEKLAEIDEYWKTRRISATANAWQPEGFKEFCELGASSYTPGQDIMGLPLGHLTPGYQKIINVGYGAIRKQARDWIEAHKGDMMGEDIKKYLFYESAAVAADAASVMVRRYGEACLKKAEGEQGAARKAELKQMGESLLWISENPARTFWEACQAILLYLLFLHVDSSYPAIALGRLDQNTWPFLKADLEAGRLTLEEAQELIDFFILKATSFYNPSHPFVIMMVGAGNTYQHTTIGGVDPETEEDATNPVTYMVLETLARLQIHDPTISLRTNRNTPEKLWECAIEATRRVGGV
ncbi:MAG: pyruvate formate lyase family protein, partial [Treponema sp.]|nr:pyruvate formate lyase family protein [Treponema sp.]